MPRIVPIENPHNPPALLALRRSLWQLAILGVAGALALIALGDAPGVLPAWLLLTPVSALLVHHREALLGLLRTAVNVEQRADYPRRRSARPQANRRSMPMPRQRPPRRALPLKQAR